MRMEKMVRSLLAGLGLALAASPAAAQSEKDAVVKPIVQLFDAMRAHDSAGVMSAFAAEGRLVSVAERDGQVTMRAVQPAQFAGAVGRAASGPPWDERIYDPEVRIDGRLATVWVKYDFLRGTEWSHCGIDAFQLAKLADGWKITQLADTRQTSGCTTPAAPKR